MLKRARSVVAPVALSTALLSPVLLWLWLGGPWQDALWHQALAQPVTMPAGQVTCNQSVTYDAATIGATKLVTGVAGKSIYVCGYVVHGGGTTAAGLISGTGTNCATNTVKLTPAYALAAQTDVHDVAGVWRGILVPPAVDVCLNSSTAVAVQAIVYVGQY